MLFSAEHLRFTYQPPFSGILDADRLWSDPFKQVEQLPAARLVVMAVSARG